MSNPTNTSHIHQVKFQAYEDGVYVRMHVFLKLSYVPCEDIYSVRDMAIASVGADERSHEAVHYVEEWQ